MYTMTYIYTSIDQIKQSVLLSLFIIYFYLYSTYGAHYSQLNVLQYTIMKGIQNYTCI